jgi:hypothetical protein
MPPPRAGGADGCPPPAQAALTDGYLCETLSSAAAIAARPPDLTGRAVAAGAGLLQGLLGRAAQAGPVSGACAAAAGSVLGQSLLAMGGGGGNRTDEAVEGEREWMAALEDAIDKALCLLRPPPFYLPPSLPPSLPTHIPFSSLTHPLSLPPSLDSSLPFRLSARPSALAHPLLLHTLDGQPDQTAIRRDRLG